MNTNTAKAETNTGAAAETAAEKLAEQVKAGERYQVFQQCVAALQADSEALGILQDFQHEQQQLAVAQQYGEASEAEMQQMQDKESKMMANPVLKAFFAAQQALIDELAEVNASISAKLGFDFAKLAKPASGCGCGGSC